MLESLIPLEEKKTIQTVCFKLTSHCSDSIYSGTGPNKILKDCWGLLGENIHYQFLYNLFLSPNLILSLPDNHICQQPILVAQTVKNCEWSENVALFQPGRLACHRFLSAGRRHGTSGSEAKLFITAYTTGSMCFTPIPHVPKSHGDHTRRPRWILHIE